MSDQKQVAIVTGGNRGMGLETCRRLAQAGYKVILTSRDTTKGKTAVDSLSSESLDVTFHQLDVTDQSSADNLVNFLRSEFGRCDVLINNAGAILGLKHGGGEMPEASAFTAGTDVLEQSLQTNTLGAYRLIQVLVPLMEEHDYGRIVNVSSGMGQLSDMNGGWPGYRVSKTALNAVTRIFAYELKKCSPNILINSVCPGWVKTDLGGEYAQRTVEEGIETTLWLATLPDDSPSGLFYRDREVIDW